MEFDAAESWVSAAVQWLRLAVETLGACVIALGVLVGIVAFVRAAVHRHPYAYNDVRLTLARYLAVALEFQVAADILSTSIAPTWTQIGKLAAIVTIRTGLNYFLSREMETEAARIHAAAAAGEAQGAAERDSAEK
jgi:uncharacterized membrane protein